MSRYSDNTRAHRLDPDSFASGYFRNAVYRHWDPYEDIADELLEQDRERLTESEITEPLFDGLRGTLAAFGAGEEAVTEDLAPLCMRLDSIEKQMFVTTQIYEEAKHAAFFDRYWRDVIDPVAEAKGFEVTAPTDERYFRDGYEELFDRTETAMHNLLEDDSDEALVEAYCHYHLAVESVLAQTGYYGIQAAYSPSGPDLGAEGNLHLEGLVEGISYIRSDEGRHVGFGMHEVQDLVEAGVDPNIVNETLSDLLPLVAEAVGPDPNASGGGEGGIDPNALVEYASEKVARRIEIITDTTAEIPPVEELVHIEGGADAGATGDD